MAQSAKAQLWRSRIARWIRSGLSQVEFCRRNGWPIYGFRWWKHRLDQSDHKFASGGRAVTKRRTLAGSFVPIKLVESRSATSAAQAGIEVELELGGGRTLRIRGDHAFNPEVLRQVVRIVLSELRGATC
jgi:hypothetical protein